MRTTYTGLLGVSAMCFGCGWESFAANAQGNAAQHHDRTGHTVKVEVTRVVIYGEKDAAPGP